MRDEKHKEVLRKVIICILVLIFALAIDWLIVYAGVMAITSILDWKCDWRIVTAVWLGIWLLRAALKTND